MSDQPDQKPAAAPPKRGDAAWKAAKEAIAERNEKAHKAGRERRQAAERQKAAIRRSADREIV